MAAAAILCLGFSLWLWFHAGCVGDTKGGSYSDPVRAVELERDAFVYLIVSVFGIAVTIASLASLAPGGRIACALGFICVGGPTLWLLGLDLETRGVQMCSRSNSRLQRPAASGGVTGAAVVVPSSDAAAAEPPGR